MKKETYIRSLKKKIVREFLFSFFNEKSIIGLAGPDINDYVEWCKEKGYENLQLWENDSNVMLNQFKSLKTESTFEYKYGNILNAEPNKRDTLYDLDYCGTIKTLYDHVKKFKEGKFVMTFCMRGSTKNQSIESFFKNRNESIRTRFEKTEPLDHVVIGTDFGKYILATYRDGSPMLCIAKIK